MKTNVKTTLVGLTLVSASGLGFASDWQTGSSASLVNQYIFRGVDANNGDAAIQIDLNAEHTSGFSIGAWGSNYNFGDDRGVEIDLYASYGHSFNDDFSASIGITQYTYTGTSDNTTEWNLGLAWKNFSFTYYDDTDLDTSYISLGGEFSISDKNAIVAHLGRADPDGDDSVRDYTLGVNHAYNDDISFFVNFTTTSADGLDDQLWGGMSINF